MDQTQKTLYKRMELKEISPVPYDHLNFGKFQKHATKNNRNDKWFQGNWMLICRRTKLHHT